MLAKLANQVYYDAMTGYLGRDDNELALLSQKFIELIEEIDTLLASDDNFLLGTWLESAKKIAANQEERKQVRSYSSWYTCCIKL